MASMRSCILRSPPTVLHSRWHSSGRAAASTPLTKDQSQCAIVTTRRGVSSTLSSPPSAPPFSSLPDSPARRQPSRGRRSVQQRRCERPYLRQRGRRVSHVNNGQQVQMLSWDDYGYAEGNYGSTRWFKVGFPYSNHSGWVHSSLVANQTSVGNAVRRPAGTRPTPVHPVLAGALGPDASSEVRARQNHRRTAAPVRGSIGVQIESNWTQRRTPRDALEQRIGCRRSR